MIPLGPFSARRRVLPAAMLCLCCAAGCDSSGVGTTFPVAGQVTLDGRPLAAKSATVLFKPDAARGNKSTFEPVGRVDEDGNYELLTQGKRGAPPGWYKVIVTALNEDPKHPSGPHRERRPVARSLVPARYGLAATTDLAVEVVENPAAGAYDLKLKTE
jgi:hypothetical protein